MASRWFLYATLGLGSLFRLSQYLSGRSLWLDEAFLSLNIIERPFTHLFGTLDHGQGAPPGFLALQRFAVVVLGNTEDDLRLVPLLAGLAALPLFFFVARRLLSPAGAGAALLLFAALDGPIIYSSEAKQYSGDVCVALAVLLASLRALDRRTRIDYLALAGVGSVTVWFSHPAAFVLVGSWTAIALQEVRRPEHRFALQLRVGAAWLASFGGVYIVNIRKLPPGLGTGTGSSYLPGPNSVHNVGTILRAFDTFLGGELYLRLPGRLEVVGGGLAVAGIIALRRRSPLKLCMLLLPALLAAVASCSGLYPWGGRFTLFLAPIAPLLVVRGAEAFASVRTRFAPSLAAGVLALVMVPSLATASWHVLRPQQIEEIRPAVTILATRFHRGDILYVNFAAQYALRYYVRDRHLGGRLRALGNLIGPPKDRTATSPPLPPDLAIGPDTIDLKAVPRRRRVWVLLSHFVDQSPYSFLDRLQTEGRLLFIKRETGVVLALFDLQPHD